MARILEEVERLTDAERLELRRYILEQTAMPNDLTDDDFGMLAAESFRVLDEEEAQRAQQR